MEQQYEITDEMWKIIEPLIKGREGQWGGIAKDNRQFINAVFSILSTGKPWSSLDRNIIKWKSIHKRYIRWKTQGIWENIIIILLNYPEYKWLIDIKNCKFTNRLNNDNYILPYLMLLCNKKKDALFLTQKITNLKK